MEQIDSARYYLNQAMHYYQQSVEQAFEYPALEFYLDGLLAQLALQENRLNDAQQLLAKPFDPTIVEPSVIYLHHLYLEEMYAKKNDYKNAYHYRRKADAYNDSLRNIKVRNNTAEMEMRFRQDTTLLRKDLRIATAEGRASQWQNIALIILLVFVIFVATVATFIRYARRKREEEYRKQVATVTGLRMEIVRNRVSPHFVFNALNAIMPSLSQHKELEQPFALLIQMLRNNLIASEQIATPLNDEIALVKNFLQLEMLGNRRKIDVNWQIADDVPTDVHIPSMSIQIPVENALKYAFNNVNAHLPACININIVRKADVISIVIDDNGEGYNPGSGAFSERGTGSGLKMLHRTVELLNMRNNNQMTFAIENKKTTGNGNGTRTTLITPLEYQYSL